MSEAAQDLRGLDVERTSNPDPKPSLAAAVRVKPVDRSQQLWRQVDMEKLIEEDHPARAIWALTGQLDLQRFYTPIKALEGRAGRPPGDPRLLISLWLYGYSRGISSGRELAQRCTYEPAFEWLCGMEPPCYHTLTDFRTDHGPALEKLFAEVLGVLSDQGLVSLERVMHDGTKIKACASGKSFQGEARLQAHLEAARQQVQTLSQQSGQETVRERMAGQRAARERQERVQEALEQLEQIRQSPHTRQKESVRASRSDPQARNMKQSDGGYAPSYNVQISTEASHKIIVGVGVSQNGSDYVELQKGLARVQNNLQAKPVQVVVDGGYTSRENIVETAAKGIDLIGSLSQQQAGGANSLERSGIAPEFGTQAFSYDAQQDEYRCPAGQSLKHIGQSQRRAGVREHRYKAPSSVCAVCQFKGQCCPKSKQGRTLSRYVEGLEVQQFREKMRSQAAQVAYRQRAEVAEFPNAWIKAKIGMRQFRLRGLVKVGLEALWACLTYNVQVWIRLCWRTNLARPGG